MEKGLSEINRERVLIELWEQATSEHEDHIEIKPLPGTRFQDLTDHMYNAAKKSEKIVKGRWNGYDVTIHRNPVEHFPEKSK